MTTVVFGGVLTAGMYDTQPPPPTDGDTGAGGETMTVRMMVCTFPVASTFWYWRI
jgi:hypothetical protein